MRKKFFFGFLIVTSVLAGFFTANHISPKAQVSAAGPDDFITTWNSGSDRVVKIPVYSANKLTGYNYTINWGDDPDNPTIQTFTDNTVPTFTYPLANTEYDITISGTFPGWTFHTYDTPLRHDVGSFAKKITKLKQWGTGAWKRVDNMFYGCQNLEAAYTDSPNLSQVSNLNSMFLSASKFNGAINFNSSSITSTESMFSNAKQFNQPVNINTTNVTDMRNMFSNAVAFNQPITFDTTNVTNMSNMFSGATAFNQPLSFNTINVKDMSLMFSGAKKFNSAITFNTANVTHMNNMFYNAQAFNQPLEFDTKNVINMSYMFYNASNFNSPVNFTDVSKVTNMSYMFSGATAFNQPINFNSSNVTTMVAMFSKTSSFNSALSLDTSNVTNMGQMFDSAAAFNRPLSFNTGSVTDMNHMFAYANSFNQPLEFDTKNVINMSYMFYNASNFNSPVNFTDVSKVTNMSYMFSGATAFNQPINFNSSNVTTMVAMFSKTSSFNSALSLDTSNVTNMGQMFSGATAFNQPLNFNTSKVTNMSYMFDSAAAFNQPLNFNTSKVTNMSQMFSSANSFNQDLSGLDFSKVTENFSLFASSSSLSVINYDKLLIAWRDQLGSSGKTFSISMSPLKYCLGEQARSQLLASGWPISGDSKDCSAYSIDSASLSLINDKVPENSPTDTPVGTLNASPETEGLTYTFSLTCATPGINDDYFAIENDQLKLAQSPDYETTPSLSFCIRTTNNLNQTLDQNFTVNILDVNETPTISGIPPTSINQDELYSFTPIATDPDTNPAFNTLTFTATGLPSWLSLNNTTGQLSGVPDYTNVGNFGPISITVSDGTLSASLPEFSITVIQGNRPPVFTSAPVLEAEKGALYTYHISAEDPDGDILTFSAPNLPAWLSFDSENNTISGIPTENNQDFNIELKVSDGKISISQSFSIHVSPSTKIDSISINTPSWIIPENSPYNTILGDINASSEIGGQFTFSFDCAIAGTHDEFFP